MRMKKGLAWFFTVFGAILIILVLVFLFEPGWLITSLETLWPGALYFVDIDQPAVALTIDDGPDAETTRQLLDVLKENNAQATFFLISNNVQDNEEIVIQIAGEGHELGNHMVEDEVNLLLEERTFKEKLRRADNIISAFGDVKWFRPGWGFYDTDMLHTAESYGYQTALASVHPIDPQIPSAEFASWYVLRHVKPGSIILLHDCGERGERTAEVLAEVLPELSERGYRVVTLSQLVEMGRSG